MTQNPKHHHSDYHTSTARNDAPSPHLIRRVMRGLRRAHDDANYLNRRALEYPS
jgi:hypothetical protein